MKAKISEIFTSVQGEGKYVGTKQVFVRFFGCDIHCTWCDTPYAKDTGGEFRELGHEKLFSEISKIWDHCHSVSLTGGEPLLQKDFLKSLLPLLKEKRMAVYLETNGILFEALDEIIEDIDIIAMDIKMPTSTKSGPFWKEHEEFLRIALRKEVFLKAVISHDTTKEDIEKAVRLVSQIAPDSFFVIQPNTHELSASIMTRCLDHQKYCLKYLRNVRIIPQMHKLMSWK